MLSRTASTSALTSFLAPLCPEKSRDLECLEESQISIRIQQKRISAPGDEVRSLSVVSAGFRKVQSESDLASAVSTSSASASCTFSAVQPHQNIGTIPQKQWSRRVSLRRNSSLPAATTLNSLLTELHQNPLPGLQESALCEEEAAVTSSEGSSTESRIHQQTCVSGRVPEDHGSSSTGSSFRDDHVFGEANKQRASSLSNVGGFGSGIGPNGSSRTGFADHDSGSLDAHYRRMLKSDPANSLLLRNYARYLYEVKGDLSRAEEYYERAILASPDDDAELRSQYARLIWEFRKDEQRAASYFEQATQASPDDCNVLGAYAAFMWDVDEAPALTTSSSGACLVSSAA